MSSKPSRRRRGQRGISLIETLVALALFAVSAATIGKFLVTHIRLGAANYLTTQAYVLVEQELEATRALRYADMAPSTKVVTIDGRPFEVDTQIVNDSPTTGLKHITVNISWSDPFGPKHVAVQTIYTEVQR